MCKRFFILQATLIVGAAVIALTPPVFAQTVINMPAPPKKAETPVAASPTLTNPAATVSPVPAATALSASTAGSSAGYFPSQTAQVGDLALARYSRARYGTYDTYSSDGMYGAGIRTYSYPRYFPQFIWGPWWGFNFGFHSHHKFCD